MAPKKDTGMGGPPSKAATKAVVGSLIAVIGDEDTVTGMLLAGIGNVDARRTSNFMVCDSKTTPGMLEEAFHRFTKRTDVAVLLINQYLATQIRPVIDSFVRTPTTPPTLMTGAENILLRHPPSPPCPPSSSL